MGLCPLIGASRNETRFKPLQTFSRREPTNTSTNGKNGSKATKTTKNGKQPNTLQYRVTFEQNKQKQQR